MIQASDLATRWDALWARLGVVPAPVPVLHELLAAYAERHRAYHTQAHLRECLRQLDATGADAARADEIELALWFHDAVYAPTKGDNERKSAEWAERAALEAGLPREVAGRVRALVLATDHRAAPTDRDAQLICDIDLAILGASPGAFDAYEEQVRREYAWVPGPIFRARRAGILRGFLDRPSIYHTPRFRTALEAAARQNLTRSVAVLSGGAEPAG